MIVVDASALMAISLEEAGWETFEKALFRATSRVIAAPTMLEFVIALASRYGVTDTAEETVRRFEVEPVPFTPEHLLIARFAFLRFGKGRGHPAKLNFGDCMSYALAKALDAPLLYKGEDFSLTDLRSAL